eukprot:1945954-Rhodomonas_salina.2
MQDKAVVVHFALTKRVLVSDFGCRAYLIATSLGSAARDSPRIAAALRPPCARSVPHIACS